MANRIKFEDELQELHNLNREDYFFYKEWISSINSIINKTGLKIPLEDTFISKLEHYTNMGCNEIGAYTLNGKKYNVGLPIMDKIEDILKNIKGISVEFGSDFEQEHFKSVYTPLLQEIYDYLKGDIKHLWLDVGCTVYDIHFEIIDSKNESTDIYLNISDDKKDLITSCGVGSMNKLISPSTMEKLIVAIQKVKINRGESI